MQRDGWNGIADRVLAGERMARADALRALRCPDEEVLDLLAAAWRVRRAHFGFGVRLHVIENAKCGLCSENCAFCSQSAVSTADIERYPLESAEAMLEAARRAKALNAIRVCIVTSAREPSDEEIARMCEAVRRIKAEIDIDVCNSLGFLTPDQAAQLKEAGVDRYNHNLETSERFYPRICRTHTYADRLATARIAKGAGLELCCGGLFGMGESDEDRVDLAEAIRGLKADSVPLNFLDPRIGTPLAGVERMKPLECLRILAAYRLMLPDTELRAAGGREACLRSLQPLALYAANSIFTSGYLTTDGQGEARDRAMIEEAGFHIDAIEA
jgi:biotin synthase